MWELNETFWWGFGKLNRHAIDGQNRIHKPEPDK